MYIIMTNTFTLFTIKQHKGMGLIDSDFFLKVSIAVRPEARQYIIVEACVGEEHSLHSNKRAKVVKIISPSIQTSSDLSSFQ